MAQATETYSVPRVGVEDLKQWLEDGTPAPTANDPHATGLTVFPAKRLMVPGETQQLSVLATWSDGRTIRMLLLPR